MDHSGVGIAPREGEGVSSIVIARSERDEAIQTSLSLASLDCFADARNDDAPWTTLRCMR
jgi:hypothetical protein